MLLIAIVRWESMDFARQASAAVFLVTVTLLLQCAGMAVLIHWARARISTGIKGLGPVHSAVLMVRFTTLMIVLHIPQFFYGRDFIAGIVFHHGKLASISRLPPIRRLAMATLFSREFGASWARGRALLAC